ENIHLQFHRRRFCLRQGNGGSYLHRYPFLSSILPSVPLIRKGAVNFLINFENFSNKKAKAMPRQNYSSKNAFAF
ncbi:MAG: hypothetical protein IKA43_00575, partial [Clostridia bacterium]|nr:hypothetical protein [Clostridia bacterium]